MLRSEILLVIRQLKRKEASQNFLYLHVALYMLSSLRLFRILISISFALLFITCKKGRDFDCFKGNGDTVTETRNLETFNEIVVYDKMEVSIHSGTEYKVVVSWGTVMLT